MSFTSFPNRMDSDSVLLPSSHFGFIFLPTAAAMSAVEKEGENRTVRIV